MRLLSALEAETSDCGMKSFGILISAFQLGSNSRQHVAAWNREKAATLKPEEKFECRYYFLSKPGDRIYNEDAKNSSIDVLAIRSITTPPTGC